MMDKKVKVVLIICAVVIVLSISVISCTSCIVSSKDKKAKALSEQEFNQKATRTFSMYRRTIVHYYIDKDWIGIYVDKDQWNNSDKQTRQTFLDEVTKLLLSDASTSGILNYTDIDVVFYDSDKNKLASYTLVPPDQDK